MHFSRGEQIVIGLCLAGLLLASGIWLFILGSRSASWEEENLLQTPPAAPREEEKVALVHVCGAVKRPGVFRVKPTNRVLEVIKFAGGDIPGADLHALNLAARIEDGERIYVPTQAETRISGEGIRSPAASGGGGNPGKPWQRAPAAKPSALSGEDGAVPFLGPINLNTAPRAQLELLPGIGPFLAQRILDHRQKKGFFGKPPDLMEVEGIGEKIFEKIEPYVKVGP